MPSIHPDFEYDIFISYRQNDNKRDHWVTQFVEALKDELEATLKNPVSIYFDENPHDGLLETHQVNASLEKKLKCLVFIPIVSQTYCDTKSFAWQHEFLPFIEMANEDELGMNITLSNGNVTSRVLPIKIHDLDTEDHNTLEAVLDGPLRSIEFIYKEPGVNSPLKPSDDRNLNLEKTDYLYQINKVANSLKNIGVAVLRNQKGEEVAPQIYNHGKTTSKKVTKPNYLRYVLGIVLIVMLGAFGYWWLTNGEAEYKIIAADKSLAVLPFKNLSGDAEHDFLSYALKDEVYQSLALGKHFAFMSSLQATFGYAKTEKTPTQIGEELHVDYLLSGFFQVMGDQLKITVELADAETGFSLWTFPTTVNYTGKDVIAIQKQIAEHVMTYFESDNKETVGIELINGDLNFVAYKHYVKGLEFANTHNFDDMSKSYEEFEKAVEMDSTSIDYWINLVKQKAFFVWRLHTNDSTFYPDFNKHIAYIEKNLPQWVAKLAHGIYEYHVRGNYEIGLSYFIRVHEEYPNNEHINSFLAAIYKRKLQSQKSVDYMSKSIQINPMSALYWVNYSKPFRNNGDYEASILALNNAFKLGLDSVFYFQSLLPRYVEAGYTFDELPAALKYPSGKVDKWSLIYYYESPDAILQYIDALELDETPGRDNYTRTELYQDKMHSYYELNQDNSVIYYAKKCIAQNKRAIEKDWYIEADAYSFLDDLEKTSKIMEEQFPYDNEDLVATVWREKRLIRFHVHARQYKKAVELLINLNKNYPEYGDFAFFNDSRFDRAKKEYPPFQEALDNLKLPSPLITGIKMDISKR